MTTLADFPGLVEAFFTDRLMHQRHEWASAGKARRTPGEQDECLLRRHV
jgi:hypothetical protein